MVLRAGRQHRGEDRPVRSDFIIKTEHTDCSGESVGVRQTKGLDRTQTDGPVITETGKVPVEHAGRGKVSSVFNALGLRSVSEIREQTRSGFRTQESRV